MEIMFYYFIGLEIYFHYIYIYPNVPIFQNRLFNPRKALKYHCLSIVQMMVEQRKAVFSCCFRNNLGIVKYHCVK